MSKASEIDYQALQQDAMRGVIRAVLSKVAADGLPGEHHFYVSFLTQAPGVILSKRLKQKYPHDMTIVLQHRFWDLIVSEDRFEVKLTFDGIPERLVVPYRAVKVFIDPSVGFGLQFEDIVPEQTVRQNTRQNTPAHELTLDATFDSIGAAQPDSPRATLAKKTRARRSRVEREAADKNGLANTAPATDGREPPFPEPASATAGETARAADTHASEPAAKPKSTAIEGGAQIFSLDQFRKK